MDAALTVLHETKNELRALRESVMELDDVEDCITEELVGDTGGVVGLCA